MKPCYLLRLRISMINIVKGTRVDIQIHPSCDGADYAPFRRLCQGTSPRHFRENASFKDGNGRLLSVRLLAVS
jgi:hypothetical protein